LSVIVADPWEWIVDETRGLEQAASWRDPASFICAAKRSYRRDFWAQQPLRIVVASEKGTVRGVLAPVLDHYGVGFIVMHGFSGATSVHDIAEDDDGRELIILYVGDYDPSGMFMSEEDLPNRLEEDSGHHVSLERHCPHARGLQRPVVVSGVRQEESPRYKWFVNRFGDQCWELDAMDPNILRAKVGKAIKAMIEPAAWRRCIKLQKAEEESLRLALDAWKGA
jgi:hypothetical protein